MRKNCKGCNNKRFVEVWQFPFVGGKVEPKNMGPGGKGDEGKPLNGRKVAFPCSRCNALSQPQVVWVGPLFEAWLKREEKKREDFKLNFQEVVNDIHPKI